MVTKTKRVTCKRCGHKWSPRVAEPRNCPNCKQPKWRTAARKPGASK